MKKHIAVIKKITFDVIALEADNPSDLFNYRDLDAYEKLPRETLEKLRRIDQENQGYWEFGEIKSEDEVIKSPKKEVTLPFKNIENGQMVCTNVDKLGQALDYLAFTRLSGYRSVDDFPFKKVEDNWELVDIVGLLNLIYGLGGLLLNLIRVRFDHKSLQSLLAKIQLIFEDYKVIEKNEE